MTLGKHCPNCGSTSRARIERTYMMRLVTGSKQYQCRRCDRRYLHVGWLFSFPIAGQPSNHQSDDCYQKKDPSIWD
jgi:hypothetical protein